MSCAGGSPAQYRQSRGGLSIPCSPFPVPAFQGRAWLGPTSARVGLRLRLGSRLRLGRRLGISGLCGIAGQVALAVLLEVGLVPAATGQAEAGRGDLALDGRGAAGRAGIRIWVGKLLQAVERVPAGSAGECIDRHGAILGPAPPQSRRSEEHKSALKSLMRNSYAVFRLKNKTK